MSFLSFSFEAFSILEHKGMIERLAQEHKRPKRFGHIVSMSVVQLFGGAYHYPHALVFPNAGWAIRTHRLDMSIVPNLCFAHR